MRAAAGVPAGAADDRAGGALGPVVADDAQPASRAMTMTDAASTGISPIRQARGRAPQGIGGEWRVTGVSLEGPGCLLQQIGALASALLLLSVSASAAGVVVGDPGCLQLDYSPGGVVHLGYGQAEPVPQAAEPFAAGPGDRLLQLPPVDEISRAGGGARRGCPVRCGPAGWVLLVWCGRMRGHCGLLGGMAGLPAWYRKLMSSAGWDRGWLYCRGRRRCSPRTTACKTVGTTAGTIPHARRSGEGYAKPAQALVGGSWHFRGQAPVGPCSGATEPAGGGWRVVAGYSGSGCAGVLLGRTGSARCRQLRRTGCGGLGW
jgi:hypothetical protein